MVFTDKAQAEKALNEVKGGKDFAVAAKDMQAENADEPTLGLVAQDELAEDLAYDTFEMPLNEPRLLQVADTWQVVSVRQIVPAKKMTFEEVKPQIEEILNNDNLYDALRDARAEIDDAVNGGKNLEEVGKMLGIEPVKVSGISETTPVKNVPATLKSLETRLTLTNWLFRTG